MFDLRRQDQRPIVCAPFVASAPPHRSSATAAAQETLKRHAFLGFLSPSTRLQGGSYPPWFPTHVGSFDPDHSVAGAAFAESLRHVQGSPISLRIRSLFAPSPALPARYVPTRRRPWGSSLQSLTVLAPAPPSSTLPSSVRHALLFLGRRTSPDSQANLRMLWDFGPTAHGFARIASSAHVGL